MIFINNKFQIFGDKMKSNKKTNMVEHFASDSNGFWSSTNWELYRAN